MGKAGFTSAAMAVALVAAMAQASPGQVSPPATASAHASASAGTDPSRLEGISWLVGCWEAVSPKRTIFERWTRQGNAMLVVSSTLRADTLVEYELVVVRQRNGLLEYAAHPSGQPAAIFREIETNDARIVFENPGHDFPQRIGYRRQGADSVVAWIEGTRGGATRTIEFPYRRVSCEPTRRLQQDEPRGDSLR